MEFTLQDVDSGKSNGITVVQNGIALPDSKRRTEHPEIELFDSYIDLYNQIDHCSFDWHLDNDQNTKDTLIQIDSIQRLINKEKYELDDILRYITCGGLNIPGFDSAFDFTNNKTLGYYLTSQELGIAPHSFIPVDFHCQLSFQTYTACLKIEENKLIDNVYILDYQGVELLDMKITLDKYMELAYACKAVYMWQFDYMKKSKKELSILYSVLGKIFPVDSLKLVEWS